MYVTSEQMHAAASRPIIDAHGLTFNYDSSPVLNELNLSISAGEIFGLLGPNGSGKTTFIRMLAGLIRPKAGSVVIDGKVPSPKRAKRIGYMPQLNALYQELSIKENVDFFARMYGMSNRAERAEAVETAIKLVNLWDRQKDSIFKLSGGMKQRVSLAVALVHRPTMLLLDEPTVGLDPDLRFNFWKRFRDMAGSGSTILLSSHSMDDAIHCHRLAFLREGKIIALGTPDELRAATGDPEATLEDSFLYFIKRSKS